MAINKKKPVVKRTHDNFMGSPSYQLKDCFLRLHLVAASAFFGEAQYYRDSESKKAVVKTTSPSGDEDYLEEVLGKVGIRPGKTSNQVFEEIIDECLDKDVEKTLKVAVELRNADYMRTTPQVILVRAAYHKNQKGTGLVLKYAPQICKRGDEPAVCMAYAISKFGRKSIPNSLKKALANVLERLGGYEVSKYRMEGHLVATVDVASLVHAHSAPLDKLFKGQAKQKKTWNAKLSGAKAEGKTKKESWEDSLKNMGHMALLRNMRNLFQENIELGLFRQQLLDGVKGGKQFPFRYLAAQNALSEAKASGPWLDAVEECLEMSVDNVPRLNGKTMVLVDNSGSTKSCPISEFSKMKVCDIGNLMGVITAKAADEGEVGIFGDRLEIMSIRKKASVTDTFAKVSKAGENIGGGTENGIWLFWDKAIREKLHYDHVFVYSDMQAGHGGLYGLNSNEYRAYQWKNTRHIDVPKLIAEYRKRVNPNVLVYLVQIAGYEDSLMPEYYDKTYILGGWSENIFNFANKMQEVNQ